MPTAESSVEKAISDSSARWHQTRIAQVMAMMQEHGVSLAEIADVATISNMVNQTQTPILPAQGYKVAGE